MSASLPWKLILKSTLSQNCPRSFTTPNLTPFLSRHIVTIIKYYYDSTPKPKVQEYDIAIHIRRGDIPPVGRYSGHYTTNDKYLTLIKFFQKEYPGRSICIYSQGELQDFSELQLPGVSFSLDGPIIDAFHGMVRAKMLVSAISTFSYVTDLLIRR